MNGVPPVPMLRTEATPPAWPYYLFIWLPPRKFIVFFISNFRHVLNVVCFLLGNSPVSEFYMPMFHRRVGTYLPTKMEQTECSKTLAYKIQMPGNYPEESIQHPLYLFSQQLCKEILWGVTILRYSQSDMLVLLHMFRPEAICVLVSSVPNILLTVSSSYLNIIITVTIKRPIIDLTVTVTVNIHFSSFTLISHQVLLITCQTHGFGKIKVF